MSDIKHLHVEDILTWFKYRGNEQFGPFLEPNFTPERPQKLCKILLMVGYTKHISLVRIACVVTKQWKKKKSLAVNIKIKR